MFQASQYYRRRMEEHDLIFKQLAQNIINPSAFHSILGKRDRDGILLRNGSIGSKNTNYNIVQKQQ